MVGLLDSLAVETGGRLRVSLEQRVVATVLLTRPGHPATHCDWYKSREVAKRDYRQVAHAQWDHTNYRSVILSKELASDANR
jgi:hypothetical protein